MAARRGMKPQWAALLLVAALALATCSRAAEFGGEGEAYDWEEDDYEYDYETAVLDGDYGDYDS